MLRLGCAAFFVCTMLVGCSLPRSPIVPRDTGNRDAGTDVPLFDAPRDTPDGAVDDAPLDVLSDVPELIDAPDAGLADVPPDVPPMEDAGCMSPVVFTDRGRYTVGGSIVVGWDCAPDLAGQWVALAPVGDPDDSFIYGWLGARGRSGTVTLVASDAVTMSPDWEIRLLDRDPSGVVIARSVPFAIAPP